MLFPKQHEEAELYHIKEASNIKGWISSTRNKTLMKMFIMVGIGERAGSGVLDIYAVWDSQRWKEPTVEEQYDPDRTILKLSLVKNKR